MIIPLLHALQIKANLTNSIPQKSMACTYCYKYHYRHANVPIMTCNICSHTISSESCI